MTSPITSNKLNIGLNFDNSYARLPKCLYTSMNPLHVSKPEIIIANHSLAKHLGLQINKLSKKDQEQLFSGNIMPEGAEPLAQAYAA